MTSFNAPDIKPEVFFVADLLKTMAEGRLRVPKFQRPFVWTYQKITYLLDSIRNRYPIGSVLLWETDKVMASSEKIGPRHIGAHPGGSVSYILDGQQRLSTLFGTLMWKEGDDTDWAWLVYYHLDTKKFVQVRHPSETDPMHFPVRSLLDTYAFLEEAERIRKSVSGDRLRSVLQEIQELADVFRSYKIPVTRIQNTNLDEAVRIFSRLNTAGVRVGPDQMVSALAFRESDGKVEYDLAAEIDRMVSVLSLKHFKVDRVILLRVILAELELDVYRTDWEQLGVQYKDKIPMAVNNSMQSLDRVVQFLDSIGVSCGTLLPYSMQLVVLSAFFRKCPEPGLDQKSLLERWFWVSSYSGWFANGNSTSIRRAIEDMMKIANGGSQFNSIELNAPANPFPSAFDFRSARVRTHVLFLLFLVPLERDEKPFKLAKIAENGYRALRYLFRADQLESNELYRSPVNRILLTYEKKEDLVEIFQNPSVRQSHGIDERCYRALLDEDWDGFLQQRKAFLMQKEQEFMRSKGVTLPVAAHEETVLDTELEEGESVAFDLL